MDSFDDNGWDLLDYSSFIDDVTSTDLYWGGQSANVQADDSLTAATPQDEEYTEKGFPRKRARNDSCSRLGTKACRDRLRRERLNKRFLELSSILEPEIPPQSDKFAILGDAIRVLNQLRVESQEFKETHEKLLEEIKALKAEKNELREEKLVLKEDKERTDQQLKAMTASPAGFLPPHPAAYHAGANKMAVFPSYGYVPMWQYLPPSTLDTSKDQELRPPAA
ncbi:transcription factor bHLH104-like [Actinidia eriantha]|uniref:transcription factor bHLH104-like n=1 Tax=Actinidia eriantha TaxID=165200 RepID=UPI002588348E|nr:transcription factor bHLH104-like [Actinidia eriantha]